MWPARPRRPVRRRAPSRQWSRSSLAIHRPDEPRTPRSALAITLQALSAAGQSRLMRAGRRPRPPRPRARPRCCSCRTTSSTARSTSTPAGRWPGCSSSACVPVINENDAIADDEIRYGDNDRLAALVAHSWRADLLRAADRLAGAAHRRSARRRRRASSSRRSRADDPLLVDQRRRRRQRPGERRHGVSKLAAAKIASWSGVRDGDRRRRPRRRARRRRRRRAGVGTIVRGPRPARSAARKLWIAFAAGSPGTVVVDDGARRALRRARRRACSRPAWST